MPSPIALAKADHTVVRDLFTEYERDSKRTDVLNRLLREVVRHAGVEEAVLYPEVARTIDGGADLVKDSNDEHQQVRDLVLEIRARLAGRKDVRPLVTDLRRVVDHHIAEEEEDLLPRLQEQLDAERLEEIGVAYERMSTYTARPPTP